MVQRICNIKTRFATNADTVLNLTNKPWKYKKMFKEDRKKCL